VDSAPWTTDYYNDDRSWHRSIDAGDNWEFSEGTKGYANSLLSFDPSSLEITFVDTILEVFRDLQPSADMDGLGDLVNGTIDRLLDRFVHAVERSLLEVSFFLDVGLADYSGIAGCGLRISLEVKKEMICEGLLWIAQVVKDFLNDPTNPVNAVLTPRMVLSVLQHTYVQFSGYGGVGLPRTVCRIVATERFKCQGVVEANLALLASTWGMGVGQWKVNFGLMFSGIPSSILIDPLCRRAGGNVDLWLFQASLYPADA